MVCIYEDIAEAIEEEMQKLTPGQLKKYFQKADAYLHKKNMLKKRIVYMIENEKDNCYFITLTINDKYMNKLKNEEHIRRAIRKYLNSLECFYIANADNGKKNGRLHYHAIVTKKPNKEKYRYGFMDIKKINYGTPERVANYLLKLTNHATKETTTGNILYSRTEKYGFKKRGL